MDDAKFQQKAINLAKESIGLVSPRPAVGAVIVLNGKVVSTGKTSVSPKGHAEANAIRNSSVNLSGSTLYCTLEPHNFESNDTSCTELIIKSGIKKVSCPNIDLNPKVNGKGFDELRQAGIEVETSWGENQLNQTEELYESYNFKLKNNRPQISAKFAMTLDGKIATSNNESKWITSKESREKVHEIRAYSDAIVTGINTVTNDNPLLTSRLNNKYLGKPRYRVVLDNNAKLNESHQIFSNEASGEVLWFTTKSTNIKKLPKHITNYNCKTKTISTKDVIEQLSEMGCNNILIESGGTLLGSFFDEKLIDKVYAFIAPSIFGGKDSPSPIGGIGIKSIKGRINLKDISIEKIKEDILIIGNIE